MARHRESARVTWALKDGLQRHGFCGDAYGMPGNPLAGRDFLQEFNDCLRFANLASTVTDIPKITMLPVAHDLRELIVSTPASLSKGGPAILQA
jgi:hypothetical protein